MTLKTLLSAALMLAVALPGAAAAQDGSAAAEPRPIPPIVEKWAKAWETDDAQGMADLFTEDGVYEDFAFQARFQGRDGVATWVKLTAENIPEVRAEILDAFQAGDRVAVRWVFHGTPLRFAAIEATGKSFAVPAVTVFEMEGDRIRRASDYYNLADLFRQVGLPAGPWTPPAP